MFNHLAAARHVASALRREMGNVCSSCRWVPCALAQEGPQLELRTPSTAPRAFGPGASADASRTDALTPNIGTLASRCLSLSSTATCGAALPVGIGRGYSKAAACNWTLQQDLWPAQPVHRLDMPVRQHQCEPGANPKSQSAAASCTGPRTFSVPIGHSPPRVGPERHNAPRRGKAPTWAQGHLSAWCARTWACKFAEEVEPSRRVRD